MALVVRVYCIAFEWRWIIELGDAAGRDDGGRYGGASSSKFRSALSAELVLMLFLASGSGN
jgi:hypothetical protein